MTVPQEDVLVHRLSHDTVRPTRASMLLQGRARRKSTFNIFDETTKLDLENVDSLTKGRRGTLLAKPVRKAVLASSTKGSQLGDADLTTKNIPHSKVWNGSRRASQDIRRRTIWIPQDDTTLMTIHPGAHTHTLRDETIQLARATATRQPQDLCDVENGSITSVPQIARPIKGRRSSLMTAPKRAPLTALRASGPNAVLGDIPGRPTGKENKAANTTVQGDKKCCPNPARDTNQLPARSQTRSQSTTNSASTSGWHISNSTRRKTAVPKALFQDSCTSLQGSKIEEYPILEQDLEHPELFEDGWLAHQEASLTQVINTIFDSSDNEIDPITARARKQATYFDLYHQSAFLELHQKLSTSISWGALRLPHTSTTRLFHDVGQGRCFVNMWLDTYELTSLRAAAEVVTARVCLSTSTGLPSSESDTNDKALRTSLRRFLTSTVLGSVPAHNAGYSRDGEGLVQAWQRTLLRSLSLILLLDRGPKAQRMSSCLFQQRSPYKKSEDFLKAICKIIIPGGAPIANTLAYLDYKVTHIQRPLSEYNYQINNLAVDVRDGVRLARLVELLMDSEHTALPDQGENITVEPDTGCNYKRVTEPDDYQINNLSQRLLYPCPTRSQKLHNVRISLNALDGIRGLTQTALSTILDSDIVDGHRQKTISVLWAIIANWGLHLLIPLDSLRAEIKRLSHHNSSNLPDDLNSPTSSPSADNIAAALKQWAQLLCRPHQIPINNLTTSFATPAPYTAIVATYASCIPSRTKSSAKPTLKTQLQALGVSPSLLPLLTEGPTIPSKSTTLCILSFLASRLIPLSRRLRAAETLQRAWRAWVRRREMRARIGR
ncbi:putative spindle organization associated protein [Elsinoe australis]|uniref:Putative spindle organization associated protein n=1 Tax=Elsinoe australis TaxID=40998 RepID=A0A4U7B095_9PEZI|nr:putative spindle organization associated protein [Elsinoe australis]